VRQPIAFRLGERVIVIPERLAAETNIDGIHHVLAHEWSHIERGDWWTWLIANIVRAVFFFPSSRLVDETASTVDSGLCG
jgi:beta-lactamase regulating signal transducer with metallopeptidase domain